MIVCRSSIDRLRRSRLGDHQGVGLARYDLSKTTISAGLSKVYTFKKRVRRYSSYKAAQDAAQGAGRGVWSSCGGDFHSAS